MKSSLSLRALLKQLAEALRVYDMLAFDEEEEHELGEPCSAEQIKTLEKKLGKSLPPSYRTFLELHNGWSDFAGDAKLLAVEDHESEWVKERLEDLEELFNEFDQDNPFNKGAIPVLLGEDSQQCLFVEPHTVRENGEMDFVALDIIEEERRFEDFTSFLQYKLNLLNAMIDNQTKGFIEEESIED